MPTHMFFFVLLGLVQLCHAWQAKALSEEELHNPPCDAEYQATVEIIDRVLCSWSLSKRGHSNGRAQVQLDRLKLAALLLALNAPAAFSINHEICSALPFSSMRRERTALSEFRSSCAQDEQEKEIALQALETAFKVMDTVQSEFDKLEFEKLHDVKSSVQAGPSDIQGAGLGLKATRDLDEGVVVALYPMHGIGIYDFYGPKQSALVAKTEDYDFLESVDHGVPGGSAYRITVPRAYSSGSVRGLFSISAECMAKANYRIFLDVNPNRERVPGWEGSLINDAAKCEGLDDSQIDVYYEMANLHKNCDYIPFGPPPFMAFITTRKVKAGEELLTSYDHTYWCAQDGGDVSDTTNEKIRQLKMKTATPFQLAMKNYANDIAELENIFLALGKAHAPGDKQQRAASESPPSAIGSSPSKSNVGFGSSVGKRMSKTRKSRRQR